MEPTTNGHLHKFKRVLRKGKKTMEFACTHPHCSYVRHADYIAGKAAACAFCEKEFIIKRSELHYLGLLRCPACSKSKKPKVTENELQERLDKILGGTA